ncbi:MAG: hypothetical protein JXR51_04595 [Bacteroidales bacterium]|nr:hypothetical protein [Bacteroidales bacterium]MBN2756436.1 hypothetical protein [Bacteroidales bacterium]
MALNLNKIKGLFIVPEDETEESKTIKKEEKKETNQKIEKIEKPVFQHTSSVSPTNEPEKGTFNKQIFNSLTKAIADSNLPGEDYLEFMDALMAMKDIPLDQKIKMQTVLATLSTKGLTVQKLLESAEYYLKVLENEKEKFKQAMAGQTHGKVDEKQKQIKTLEQEIQKKSEQIKILTDEITNNQENISKIKESIKEADVKIKSTENNFNITYEHVEKQIKENIETIKSLSPNNK